jgi:hypothetical protein
MSGRLVVESIIFVSINEILSGVICVKFVSDCFEESLFML